MRVAVTGATGFIGTRLIPLLIDQGHSVRALTRSPRENNSALTWVRGDLSDHTALERLVVGAEAVLHIAGAVRGRTREDFFKTNVTGLRLLLDAIASTAPSTRLLYFSSITAAQPQLSHYAWSKAQAENLLKASKDLDWTVFRPTAVYGPGDTELLPLFHAMRRGLAVIPGRSGLLSFVHVDDVIDATLTWLSHAELDHQIFEIHDGRLQGYDWQQILSIMQTLAGRTIHKVHLPHGVLRVIAQLNLGLSQLTGNAPMLTPEKLNELFHPDWRCQDNRFSELTGWIPRLPLARGLAATFAELDAE